MNPDFPRIPPGLAKVVANAAAKHNRQESRWLRWLLLGVIAACIIAVCVLLSGCDMTREEAYTYEAKRLRISDAYWTKRERKADLERKHWEDINRMNK